MILIIKWRLIMISQACGRLGKAHGLPRTDKPGLVLDCTSPPQAPHYPSNLEDPENLGRRQFVRHIEAILPFELKKSAITYEAHEKAAYDKRRWDRFYI